MANVADKGDNSTENRNDKKKRTKSLAAFAIVAGLAVIAVGLWFFYYQGRTYDSGAVGHVDGTVDTGTNKIDEFVDELPDANPVQTVTGKAGGGVRVALVFTGFTGDSEQDAAILKSLRDKGVNAAFALSAAEALENREGLKNVVESGSQLVSNGASGETDMQSKSLKSMTTSMYKSRRSLSAASDSKVDLVYCSGSELTGDVLRAASVSGYEAAIDARDENLLGQDSFKEAADAQAFVGSLSGDTVVVFNLRGAAETAQNESSIVAEKPAINKQADLKDDTADDKTESTVAEQVSWLIDALAGAKVETVPVGSLERTDGLYSLKSEALASDAERAPIYKSCLTAKDEVGVGVSSLPTSNNLSSVCELLEDNDLDATWFVTPDDIASNTKAIKKLIKSGAGFGLNLTVGEFGGLGADAIFDKLYDWQRTVSEERGYTGLALVADGFSSDELLSIRAAAQVLKIKLMAPASPKKPQAGSLYMVDDLNMKSLGSISDAAEKASLRVVGVAQAVKDSGTIPTLDAQELSALKKQNERKLAKVNKTVYTSDRMASFVFYGVSNAATTRDTAARMAERQAKGTYFCTLDELMSCGNTIEYLLDQGDDIGIYYRVTDEYPATFDAVASYINAWQRYAEWRFGATSNVVFSLGDLSGAGVREGVSAMGCKLIKNTFLVVRDEDEDIDADDVSKALDEIDKMRVTRGSFICFNLDFYANDTSASIGDQTVVGSVLDGFSRDISTRLPIPTMMGRSRTRVVLRLRRQVRSSRQSIAISPIRARRPMSHSIKMY